MTEGEGRDNHRNETMREAALAHMRYLAMERRVYEHLAREREERDAAIKRACEAGNPKKKLATALNMTPQWLNAILRGTAYKRRLD
jgi:hypothetical protein